jgi:hypothetical protein
MYSIVLLWALFKYDIIIHPIRWFTLHECVKNYEMFIVSSQQEQSFVRASQLTAKKVLGKRFSHHSPRAKSASTMCWMEILNNKQSNTMQSTLFL